MFIWPHSSSISSLPRSFSCPVRSSRSTCRARKAISACWPVMRRWSRRCVRAFSPSSATAARSRSSFSAASPKCRPAGLTVLADTAATVEDFDRAVLATHIKTAEDKVAKMDASELLRQGDHPARSFPIAGLSPAGHRAALSATLDRTEKAGPMPGFFMRVRSCRERRRLDTVIRLAPVPAALRLPRSHADASPAHRQD